MPQRKSNPRTTPADGTAATHTAALIKDPAWEKYPPLVTLGEAAEILRVPLQTVYAWSSQGVFGTCKVRVGGQPRLLRNCLIQRILDGELHA